MKQRTQKQPKPNIIRPRHYNCALCKTNGSTNNLPCYSPDSHQSHNAVY